MLFSMSSKETALDILCVTSGLKMVNVIQYEFSSVTTRMALYLIEVLQHEPD